MSHTIGFKGRLEGAGVTAPLAELLLAKLQIHELTRKDVQDMAAVLAAHPVGDGTGGTIDAGYVAGLLARDWGLCRTALANLEAAGAQLAGAGVPAAAAAAPARIAGLRQRIEAAPKTMRWKARAAVGARVRWYDDVGVAGQQGQGDAGLTGR
jgi:hypothetical protein